MVILSFNNFYFLFVFNFIRHEKKSIKLLQKLCNLLVCFHGKEKLMAIEYLYKLKYVLAFKLIKLL